MLDDVTRAVKFFLLFLPMKLFLETTFFLLLFFSSAFVFFCFVFLAQHREKSPNTRLGMRSLWRNCRVTRAYYTGETSRNQEIAKPHCHGKRDFEVKAKMIIDTKLSSSICSFSSYQEIWFFVSVMERSDVDRVEFAVFSSFL